jgi:CPA2 family monovalent cation:H+ antiporter-2
LPMRDAFAVLFFVSVGMLFDPAQLWHAPGQIALTLAIVLVAKPLSAWLIVRALGKPARLAASVAVALAQIGEFSFVLASVSHSLGILPADAASNLVAAAVISISINPILYKWARRFTPAQSESADVEPLDKPSSDKDLAIIVGHGPAGQVLRRILVDNGLECATIELNVEVVQSLKRRGQLAVYGDATRGEVLKAAGVEHAKALFLTAGTLEGAPDVIRAAKEMNASVRVFARTSFLVDVGPLSTAGAHSVISAEGEVALAMATGLLEDLGASPEQIDRERSRVMLSLRKWIDTEVVAT